MPTRRHDHACYTVDGDVLVIGGFNDATNFETTATYDVDTDRWRRTRAPMPTARGLFGSCRVDGAIHVIAGKRLHPDFVETGETPQYDVFDTHERYDPDTDRWTTVASTAVPRAGLGAAAVDGRCYAVGGMCCEDPHSFPDPSAITDLVEVYDPAADDWTRGPPLPHPRMGPVVERVGDRLVVAGGSVDGTVRDDVIVLDPVDGTWSSATPMSIPRRDAAAIVHDGRLVVFGGLTNGDGRFEFTGTVETYDPRVDRWHRRSSLPTAKAWAAATTVADRAVVVGGARRTDHDEYVFLNEIHERSLL